MLSRRSALFLLASAAAVPGIAAAETATEITWDDLIPAHLPYPEIIGEGIMDEAADYWRPVYDENATKLNPDLDGAYIRMPGFIVPLEAGLDGVTEFLLVPYVGACIHTPPPPANQLVLVSAKKPWPSDQLWDAVWVIGQMRNRLEDTDLGETGYFIAADEMEIYEW